MYLLLKTDKANKILVVPTELLMLISIVHKNKFVHWYAKFIYHHQTLACEKLEVTFNLQMFATNLIV